MERFTIRWSDGGFMIADETKVQHDARGYYGDAIDKLAKFENLCDDLRAKQAAISKELESLRSDGKTHSAKFRQLLGNKITNSHVLTLLESSGLL